MGNNGRQQSFTHKTLAEGMEILEIITENTSFAAESVPFHEQHKSCHEDILGAKSDHSLSIPLDSALEPSPEPRVLEKEEIRTPELHYKFEDDPFEDFKTTSKQEETTGSRCFHISYRSYLL